MNWDIQHVMSSPRYPQGNGHTKKSAHVVKIIYEKCDDIKLGLLLLKSTPVMIQDHEHKAPADILRTST